MLAAELGLGDVVEALMSDRHCNVREVDNEGCNALHYAVRRGHQHVVDLLLPLCMPLPSPSLPYPPLPLPPSRPHFTSVRDSSTGAKETAVHLALEHGYWDMGRSLLAAGCNAEAVTVDGVSPIHLFAAGPDEPSNLVSFLAKGSDINIRNGDGLTPLSIAERAGNERLADLLRRHGAKR